MTNGSDRLDRVERMLVELVLSPRQLQEQAVKSHWEFAARQKCRDEAFDCLLPHRATRAGLD